MLLPLLFSCAQIYNLKLPGSSHELGAYLPQPAGELFAATPTSQYNNPARPRYWCMVASHRRHGFMLLKTDLEGDTDDKSLLRSEWIVPFYYLAFSLGGSG